MFNLLNPPDIVLISLAFILHFLRFRDFKFVKLLRENPISEEVPEFERSKFVSWEFCFKNCFTVFLVTANKHQYNGAMYDEFTY